jgi:hypothetical protein
MKQHTPTRAVKAALCLAAASLSACVATVPVKDMIGDRASFLATQFAPTRLRPEVKAAVDKGALATPAFKSMSITYLLAGDDDGVKRDIEGKALVLNAGGGLFQRQDELSKNGFPYRINNQLDYAGLRPLVWQSGFHTRSNAEPAIEVKQLTRLPANLATAKAGDELVIENTVGGLQQTSGYTPFKVVCKAGAAVAASTVNVALEGEALPLSCSRSDENGTAISKTEYVFLKRYGFTLTTSYSSSRQLDRFTYTRVEIRS